MSLERSEPLPRESPRCFAHTRSGSPPETWQELSEHLEAVGQLASKHASQFQAEDWGRLAGLWHDLGKYSGAFQAYLKTAESPDGHEAENSGRVDHSTAGAQHAVATLGIPGHLLAFAIAGHHSGLLDSIADGPSMLARLGKPVEPWASAPPALLEAAAPELPPFVLGRRDAFTVGFFVRMLFSALVDADFLDTERFMDPERAKLRPSWPDSAIHRMAEATAAYIARLHPDPTEVNRQRNLVLQACLKASERSPGLFSLTVPTGGGKTLSSLAFALHHARRHGLRRIIYVVPFTSIIEQNADVFRDVMASLRSSGLHDPVVEHHSNLDPEAENTYTRLATENWDAPLVVTTSVQFYESLFANRSSRCRKLHNIARSVIILDEAQVLPVDLLAPCLRALRELSDNYGSTVVLCTATQPAVQKREGFPIGLDIGKEHEIIPDPDRLFAALKRVRVSVESETLRDDDLVERLRSEHQVLCIVNTRHHALALADLLGATDENFHLSALMCAEHRTEKLTLIRERLERDLPCRVVSTRLIEAGVDVDFPVVYRALSGVDSIAQAAGRCNRNGSQPEGRTIVFNSEHRDRERFLFDTAGAAKQVLELHPDPLTREAVEHYFQLYYWDQSRRWDAKDILHEFSLVQDRQLPFLFGFRRVAERFRLIEEVGRAVIVPWGRKGARLCQQLRASWLGPSVALRRALQRYTVQISEQHWRQHRSSAIEIVHEQYSVLAFPDVHYSEHTGLRLSADPAAVFVT